VINEIKKRERTVEDMKEELKKDMGSLKKKKIKQKHWKQKFPEDK
jgi:hypothetical protein